MASESTGKHRSQRSTTERTRLLGIGAFLVIAILFAILNLHTVSVNWIVTTTHTALTLVIIVAFLLGAGVGALITHRRAAGNPPRSRSER
jgi:uncharacterized integral membrane protein